MRRIVPLPTSPRVWFSATLLLGGLLATSAWPLRAQTSPAEPPSPRPAFTTTVQRLPLANPPPGAEPTAPPSAEAAPDASGLMALWHWPRGEPLGLVLLQHGFTRRCGNLSGLAQRMANARWAVLCIEANMAGGQPRLAAYLAQALQEGQIRSPRGQSLPRPWVVAGHSAGGFFALNLAAELKRLAGPQASSPLAGVLLFDAVAGRDKQFETALAAVLEPPGVRVSAWPARASACNARSRGLSELLAAAAQHPASVTVHEIDPGSTHLDAEGADTDLLAVAACREGPPNPAIVDKLEAGVIEALAAIRP